MTNIRTHRVPNNCFQRVYPCVRVSTFGLYTSDCSNMASFSANIMRGSVLYSRVYEDCQVNVDVCGRVIPAHDDHRGILLRKTKLHLVLFLRMGSVHRRLYLIGRI